MNTALQTADYTQNFDTLLYRVRPGDSLVRILQRYHTGLNSTQLAQLIEQVQTDNPSITNPDRIKTDQLISLKIPQQYCAAPLPNYHLPTIRTENQQWVSELERTWERSTREERDILSTLLPAFIGVGTVKMSMIDTTFTTNTPLMREMVSNYEKYKAGQRTKGQYDYQRRKLVSRLTTNLGPTNLMLNGGRTPSEVLRISRTKGATPTVNIEAKMRKMRITASHARAGGILLTGASLGLACNQIASTRTQRDKNNILVETAGGVFGSLVFSLGTSITLIAMATPVGWVGGLIIGIGSVAAGYAGSRTGLAIYDLSGAKVDIFSKVGIGAICSAPQIHGRAPTLSNSTLSIL